MVIDDKRSSLENLVQEKDSLMDVQGAQEEPEIRPGGPGNPKTGREVHLALLPVPGHPGLHFKALPTVTVGLRWCNYQGCGTVTKQCLTHAHLRHLNVKTNAVQEPLKN